MSTMTTADRRTATRGVARVGRDLRHDAARRLAARGHLAHRRRQAAHRRAARLARRRLHRGRLARAPTRRTTSSSGGRRPSCSSTTSTLVAFGSTRRAEGQGRRRRHAAPPRRGRHVGTVCIVGKCWDYHVTEALAPRSTRAWPWSPTRSRSSGATGLRRVLRRRALLRRLQAQPRVRAPRARGGGRRRAPTRLVLCDTNGGSLPARGRAHRRARSSPTSAATSASASTCTTTPARGVANALAGVRGGATQVQGTINGYGERTGNCNLTTIIPNLTLKMGIATIPRDRLERLTPVAHHVAELVNMPLNPQAAVRRALGVRAQGRPARRARSPSGPTPTSTSRPSSVGNGTRFVVSELAGQVDARAQGEGARPRARRAAAQRRGRRRSSGSSTRATTSRWPTARSSC